ncbi:Hpt domain-containing protein [Pseudodesulfovibrio cashew]|uniref:Hpt domain-containing protein n=1 Tax=Pseudodesulfovibrio cashew TaxID=2678688 RepID=A0A6I6JQC1_9BACT|nr:Hpt domain-containing protein [Pseudodesulfovibrio cashew]QGY39854.1 Hpt domain-containing protein [Pseudodesulfovibrio cashew]
MTKFTVTVDAMLEPIMDRYLELRREELLLMEQAAEAGDAEDVRMLGHRLKGTGASYGFARLTELGAAIEDAGKTGAMDLAKPLIAEVRGYLDNVSVVFEERG